MPEMQFAVRWPDGTEASYYSPSLVVHDYLTTGSTYPVREFVARADEALGVASDRVRARFGFACTSAMHTRELIATAAEGASDGEVVVLRMQPPLDGAGS